MCFSLLLLPQGANPIVRVSSFFPAHWIYISRCDPSEQRVCCILSGRRRIFHLQLLWSKEKKHFFNYLRLMLTVAVSAKN